MLHFLKFIYVLRAIESEQKMAKTNYEYVKDHRRLTKERVFYVMGEKCALCGLEDKCMDIYDFHHINPQEKDFTISQGLYNNSWSTLVNELKKGALLCANCHRRVHSNFEKYSKSLKSSFIPERADEITILIEDLKTHKLCYCKNCGKIISAKAERCIECEKINRRIVERPSREELKQLIRIEPFIKIGSMFNVTDNAIRKWCDGYKLPRTKKEINNYTDEEWENI